MPFRPRVRRHRPFSSPAPASSGHPRRRGWSTEVADLAQDGKIGSRGASPWQDLARCGHMRGELVQTSTRTAGERQRGNGGSNSCVAEQAAAAGRKQDVAIHEASNSTRKTQTRSKAAVSTNQANMDARCPATKQASCSATANSSRTNAMGAWSERRGAGDAARASSGRAVRASSTRGAGDRNFPQSSWPPPQSPPWIRGEVRHGDGE
ncbi:hypothetical protein EJB05_06391, partial [Eragrostis curvula]